MCPRAPLRPCSFLSDEMKFTGKPWLKTKLLYHEAHTDLHISRGNDQHKVEKNSAVSRHKGR
jgi:hypothetical protein